MGGFTGSSGGSPGGTNGQLQYNNNGAFGGTSTPALGTPASGNLQSCFCPLGTAFDCADPTLKSWSWFNQGGASVSTYRNTICLSAPGDASQNLRGYYETAGTGAWTRTAIMSWRAGAGSAGSGFPCVGIFAQDSATGNNAAVYIYRLNTTTSISYMGVAKSTANNWATNKTTLFGSGDNEPYAINSHYIFLQLVKNGTTVAFNISAGGGLWRTLYSDTYSNLGLGSDPNNAGIFLCNAVEASYSSDTRLFSWQ